MKKLFLLFALYLPFPLLGQSKNDSLYKAQLARLEAQISKSAESSSRIPELEKKIDYQGSLNDRTLNSISNQISAASFNLTLFGILFSIVAIGLGIYITIIERKIVRISEENKSLLAQNQHIKKEVVELNNLIQNDISGLYKKLKREETVGMIDRLILVPNDIINLADMLVSRDLIDDDFNLLKVAYSNLEYDPENDEEDLTRADYMSRQQFKLLFFQHFLRQSLKDTGLQTKMIEYFPTGIKAAFTNDILKSTKDFTQAILDLDIKKCGLIITEFFGGLTDSKFKDFNDVYQSIFDGLGSRLNQFEFFNLITGTPQTRIAKINFGNLLLEKYSDKELSVTEQQAFTQLQQLKDGQIQPNGPVANNV